MTRPDPIALRLGDSSQALAAYPDDHFDAVVTDPPYEPASEGQGHDRRGVAFSVPFWAEALRVLKPGGHLLAFGRKQSFHRLVCAVEFAGFEICDNLLWGFEDEVTMEMLSATDDAEDATVWAVYLESGSEPILLARKPLGEATAPATARDAGAVRAEAGPVPAPACHWEPQYEWPIFYCPRPPAHERGPAGAHPVAKPLALMRWGVRLVTPPGGTVLDPFLGSGTTALACREGGFGCIGVEVNPEYLAVAEARLRAAGRRERPLL